MGPRDDEMGWQKMGIGEDQGVKCMRGGRQGGWNVERGKVTGII